MRALEVQQLLLDREAAAETRQRTIRADDAMAGNDDGNGIADIRQAHRARGFRVAEIRGQPAVRRGLAVGNVQQAFPDPALEIGAALTAAGHRSLVVSAGGRLVPELERGGSRHIELDLGRKSLRTLRHVHSLRRLLERERPDIVHARSRLPAWIEHFALRGMRAGSPNGREDGTGSGLSDRRTRLVTSVHGLNSPGRYSAILIRGEPGAGQSLRLAYNILQAAGSRSFKTDYVACPSCGRTLFNLQTVTARIKSRTDHLKGVKIAIMGCIVNGPGEMADADFGYVGGAPGKINLYVGKTTVKFNIPEAEAVDRLVDLIREHGKWVEPELEAEPVGAG